MTILDLLKEDGLDPKWVASTDGGEFASPCPGCGGTDRFRSWPKKGKGGRWWCRQCEKSGDLIQYLREFRDMSYLESCRFLKIRPNDNSASACGNLGSSTSPDHTPFKVEAPPAKWQETMEKIVQKSKTRLKSRRCKYAREWLKTRGLEPEVVARNSLGWHDQDLSYQRKSLGLPQKYSDQGRSTKVWIPEGLIIPCYKDGLLQKLSVRRSARGDLNRPPDDGGRHVMVSGSSARVNMIFGTTKEYVIVVESDLDAILLDRLAGDIITAISLGSSANKPDYEATKLLNKAEVILVSLDHDESGTKATDTWWLPHFPNAKWWPVPKGKDPGEAYQLGVDLRLWIRAGLSDDAVFLDDPIAPNSEGLSIEDVLNGAW